MTVPEALARVEAIRAKAHDDEMAHEHEDELHRIVLQTIAEHSIDAESRALAQAALSSDDIDFSRWCA